MRSKNERVGLMLQAVYVEQIAPGLLSPLNSDHVSIIAKQVAAYSGDSDCLKLTTKFGSLIFPRVPTGGEK
jgi:hypothetical protein